MDKNGKLKNGTMKKTKIVNILTILFQISFICLTIGYFLFVGYYSRLSADDYSSQWVIREHGVFGTAVYVYMTWGGSFLLQVIDGIITTIFGHAHTLFAYSLFLITAYYLVMCFFLVSIHNYLLLKINYLNIFFISAVVLTAFYFATPDIGMLWHWISGSSVYILSILFLLLGLALLIRRNYFLSIFPLLVFTHCRITWDLIFFLFYFLGILFTKGKEIRKKHIFIFSILCIGAIIYVIAPGNYIRHTATIQGHHHASFGYIISHYLTNLYIYKMSYALLAIFLLIPFCKDICYKITAIKIPKIVPLAVLIVSTLIQMVVLYVAVTDFYFTDRVWSLFTLLAIFVLIYYFSVVFVKFEKRFSIVFLILFFIGLVGSNYLYIKTMINNRAGFKAFSEQYDKRMNYILSQKSKTITVLKLDKIQPPNLLYYVEFSEDPNNWVNSDFKKALELPFDVILDTRSQNK